MLLPMLLCAMTGDVAVLPLAGRRVDPELVLILDDVMTAEIAKNHKGRVIGTRDLESLLDLEQMKDALACNDVACAAEIGGALGTQYLVNGSVNTLGDQLIIQLSLINTRSMVVEARSEISVVNDETRYAEGMREAVARLYGTRVDFSNALQSGARVRFSSLEPGVIRARALDSNGQEHVCEYAIQLGRSCAFDGLPPGKTEFTFETEEHGPMVETLDINDAMVRLDYQLSVKEPERAGAFVYGLTGIGLGVIGLLNANVPEEVDFLTGETIDEGGTSGLIIGVSVVALAVGSLFLYGGFTAGPSVEMSPIIGTSP